jgi:Spy/CpxP family protein refolding chaperone
MMKWIALVVMAGVLAAAPAAIAGGGACCGGKKAETAGCTKGGCSKGSCDAMAKELGLSDEQKAKISEIKAGCDGSKESCAKAKDSIRALLTADQQKAFDEKCAAGCEKKSGCTKEKAEDKA